VLFRVFELILFCNVVSTDGMLSMAQIIQFFSAAGVEQDNEGIDAKNS
jgi:hypothetical protein